jgi:hypothetical protein
MGGANCREPKAPCRSSVFASGVASRRFAPRFPPSAKSVHAAYDKDRRAPCLLYVPAIEGQGLPCPVLRIQNANATVVRSIWGNGGVACSAAISLFSRVPPPTRRTKNGGHLRFPSGTCPITAPIFTFIWREGSKEIRRRRGTILPLPHVEPGPVSTAVPRIPFAWLRHCDAGTTFQAHTARGRLRLVRSTMVDSEN